MHLPVLLRAGLVAGAIAVAALLARPAGAEEAPRPTLTLTGTGEVFAEPDTALISSGVVTEAKTAREALDANNEAIAAVIAAIKDAGIEPKDIQTSGFTVQPRYHYPKKSDEAEAPKIVGYRVSNTVTVKVRDLAKLGGVLDKAVTVGANNISGIDFLVSDADKRLDEARAIAMKDAIRKAGIYADAAGVKLTRIVSINEVGGYRPMPRKAAMAMRAEAAPSVPVEAGEQALSVEVNVTWEIGG
jgi:uncharacterized protein YggE